MALWEKTYWVIAVSIVISGGYYFSNVLRASLELGAIVPPNVTLFITYIAIQVILAITGIIAVTVIDRMRESEDTEEPFLDERDKIVKTKSEAGAGHVTATIVVIALLAFFHHGDGNLLFHSVLAGLMLGEMARCLMQIISYRQGV